MIFYEKTIKNNFKFQIGKRYKINSDLCKNGLTFFKSFGEIEYKTHIYMETKIYEVKIFDRGKKSNGKNITFDFKIKKEINYKNKIDQEILQKRILILKCHDSETIDEVLNSDFNYIYYSDIIKTKIPKYFDMICPYFQFDNILENFFIEYANEKQIDMIINKSRNIYTLLRILDFFSTKYFNIIRTGIDEYLDYFISNSNNQAVLVEISKIGRKKDLDYFLKNISKFEGHYKNELFTQIAHFGNDDHLDSPELIKSIDYSVYNELFHHGRTKDLNEMKNYMQVSYLFDFDSVKFPW